MTDQPQDPQALLAQIVHCLATPTTSTVGDYIDAKQQLDDYCAANGYIWSFDDDGFPYLEKYRDLARRVVEGIAELANREAEMIPVAELITTHGGLRGYTFENLPCKHKLLIWHDEDLYFTGIFYCSNDDCGAGYTLVFGDDGELIGVEPWGR